MTKKKDNETIELYDSEVENRLAYKVFSDDEEIETAVTFAPCSDERYVKWLRDFDLKGQADDLDDRSMEATCKLFAEIALKMENTEFESDDWHALVPVNEKVDAINNLFAVAVFRPEKQGDGVRRLTANPTQTVLTEAYFNGKVLRQTHKLNAQSIEWKKKYAQIQAKRFKREVTRGLNRPPRIEFVPQDEKIGRLYDEMVISTEGFKNDVIPLRFKTAVVQFIFESELQPTEKK